MSRETLVYKHLTRIISALDSLKNARNLLMDITDEITIYFEMLLLDGLANESIDTGEVEKLRKHLVKLIDSVVANLAEARKVLESVE